MRDIHALPLRTGLSLALAGVSALLGGNAAPAAPGESAYIRKGTWAETMSATREQRLAADASAASPASSCFRPYNSGPIPGTGAAQRVSLSVQGVQVLRLQTFCEAGTANCNIWGEPRLIARDGTETRLTSLKPLAVRVGWGQLLLNTNWMSHPLRVGDRQFGYGLWVHADSELQFALGGKFDRFEAFVGEDADRANGAVRFAVLAGEPASLPAFWLAIREAYPEQTAWVAEENGDDGVLDWFAKRDSARLEQEWIGRQLGRIAPRGIALRGELDRLDQAGAPPGDARWLQLYARACRARACAAGALNAGAPEATNLLQQIDTLIAAGAAESDKRWVGLQARATQFSEIEEQFGSLLHDLQQRAAFARVAAETYRPDALILASDRDPLDVVVRRTDALLADLKKSGATARVRELDAPWAALKAQAAQTDLAHAPARQSLFHQACALRRQIAFANPLLDFDRILFIKRHRAIYNHMCDQFYGITARPGGGLYVLENPFGPEPRLRDVLAGATVQNGRLKGQRLVGGNGAKANLQYDGTSRLSGTETTGGAFLSPALSCDAQQILFAYVECAGDREQQFHTDASRGHWAEGRCYHIFRVNVDGSNLRQLTDGTWNEFDPCWLPNGRIAFISERRGGYLRCGRACPIYTLYDMAADGSGINLLSIHDSNEWGPSVTHDGRIVWTRWDYIDRFGCIAHAPWITRLDGTDPRALHGNFAPRQLRPDMELGVQAIPGSPKFVATAAPHHGQAFGSLILIDPRVPDDDGMGPVKRLTPEVAFPESQGGREVYGTPYPLSDDYHLCVYDASMQYASKRPRTSGSYGIYLIDSFGNRELLCEDPAIGCLNPIPLRPTPVRPVTVNPGLSAEQAPIKPGDGGEATMAVVNVFNTLKPCPPGSQIRELRILQLLPCSVPSGFPPHQTGHRIAGAGDSIVPARWVLGTVPIEADGSAHFKVPANRELFFQLVDQRGMAVQSMRSGTAVRRGEQLVCQGCHEPKHRASTAPDTVPLALRRSPSAPKPDVSGSNPFSYPLLVQPVLERNCVACHDRNPGKAPNLKREPLQSCWYASYRSLLPYAFTDYGDNYRTVPGRFGAQGSKLIPMLEKGHHDVKLPPEDFHRLTLWLDCASMFYGVFEKEGGEAQLRGEVVKATLE